MSAKRRAGHAALPPDVSTPDPAKRRKRNDERDRHFPDHENVGTTQELGGKILRLLRKSQDKNGRNVATHFLDLPDPDEYPDYYVKIPMPLSLNSIEDRLNNGEYDTMEKLESDLKRMVQNAKDYNNSKSEIFEDAERIRKALSNFMPKHNLAYLNADYKAYPTPIPQELQDRANAALAAAATPVDTPSAGTDKVKLVFTRGNKRASQVAEVDEEAAAAEMLATQLEILEELSAQENAINFEEKPSKREIPHYYKVIERPTSINDVRKMVQKGQITDYVTFAKEVRLIWQNAKEYNEPGSEIFDMAEELETFVQDKLLKHGVAPPITTRISLSQPRPKRLNLKVGSSTPTPSLPGGSVDSESLRRQKEETGQALTRATRGSSKGYTNGSTPAPLAAIQHRRSMSINEPNDVHISGMNGHTAVVAHQPEPEPVKAIPLPGLPNVPTPAYDIDPPFVPVSGMNGTSTQARNMFAEPDSPLDRKYRDPGKGIKDALLGSVTYMTHPNLPNDPKWKITRYASATRTQTASYIYLPHDHFYLRVIPTLTPELLSRRKHKLVVTHNWQVMQPAPTIPHGSAWEFRLSPGENSIAVDVVAELPEGEKKDYAPPQLQLDFERITFYIYLRDREE